MLFRNRLSELPLAWAFAICAIPLAAQTTPDPTCTTPPPGVAGFLIEHAVDLAGIKTSFMPNLPPDIFATIVGGTQEVRSRIMYDSTTKMVANDLFFVAPGSPTPTPSDKLPTRFAFITANIDKVYTSCLPRPTVMLVGTLTAGYPIFGNPAGAPYAFSFRYTPEASPKLFDVVSLTVGLGDLYAQTAPGTVTFPVATAAIAGGPTIQTLYRQLVLDGTASASTGGALTYSWSSSGTGVAIIDPAMSSTRVQIGGLTGDYPVTLTVRNALGQTATSTVVLRFVGR